jgi:hypothetical protein
MEHVSYLYFIKYLNIQIAFILIKYVLIVIGVLVVYALLPDCKAVTYVHLLNVLFAGAKKLNKKFDPLLIMTDFEACIAKAIILEVQ